jgi:hypothetical protein
MSRHREPPLLRHNPCLSMHRSLRPILGRFPTVCATLFGSSTPWNGTIATALWARPVRVSSLTWNGECSPKPAARTWNDETSKPAPSPSSAATRRSARTPFYLSRNERSVGEERPSEWRIYRVHLFAKESRVFAIARRPEEAARLSATLAANSAHHRPQDDRAQSFVMAALLRR